MLMPQSHEQIYRHLLSLLGHKILADSRALILPKIGFHVDGTRTPRTHEKRSGIGHCIDEQLHVRVNARNKPEIDLLFKHCHLPY